MNKLKFISIEADGLITHVLQSGEKVQLRAQPGVRYRLARQEAAALNQAVVPGLQMSLRDAADEEAALALVARREGTDLRIDYSDGTEVILGEFFEACAGQRCSVELPGRDASVSLSGDNVSGSGLVYAYGPSAELQAQGLSADSFKSLAASGDVFECTSTDSNDGWLWILPVAALAALRGHDSAAPASDTVSGTVAGGPVIDSAAPVNNTVSGTIVGGPVIEGHSLSVEVFQADGRTKLGQALVKADGSFSVLIGSYSGVVVARVIDGDDAFGYSLPLDTVHGQGYAFTAPMRVDGAPLQTTPS